MSSKGKVLKSIHNEIEELTVNAFRFFYCKFIFKQESYQT